MKFIRIKEYVIKVDDICYIKEIGAGCTIVCKFGTISISDITRNQLVNVYLQLNQEELSIDDIFKEEK